MKDYNTLFTELIEYAQEHELISTNIDFPSLISENKDIENFTVLLLSIIAKLYEEVYTDIERVQVGYNIYKATGDDLDNLGALKGVSRPQATSCSADLTFTLSEPLKQTTIITTPIIVATSDDITYATVNTNYTVPAGTTTFTMTALSEKTGVNQRVSANTLTTLKTKLPTVFGKKITVTNIDGVSGGTDTATDDEYRQYLINSDYIYQKGTRWAYKNYLDRYNGLDSYNLHPQWDGTGTMKVIVDVADSEAYHVQKIHDEIQETVAWADDDLQVITATHVPIQLSLSVNVDIDRLNPYSASEKEDILARILQAVLVYVNGGRRQNNTIYKGLCIGDDFIPYKLNVFLDSEVQEIKNITVISPTEPVTISNEEIAYITLDDINVTIE
jgi:uncharacterized phage protein gp47/JayE